MLGLHREPTLAVKDSCSPMFSQGGEPSRVFIAHPCWWEGEEATCRQVRDPSWVSLLFTQLQKPLELIKGIHRVNTNHVQQGCCSLVGQHQAGLGVQGCTGLPGSSQQMQSMGSPAHQEVM